MHSKNDVFSTDWSVKPPPPRARPSTSVISTEPASRREQELPSTTTDTSKVSTAATDGLSSVPKIIEPPATPSVEPTEGLEVCLLSDSELGHGRHATVHLALYREHNEGRFRLGNDTSSAEQSTSDYIWKICAAKRFAPGKEAQMAGLSEALMLSRLAKCPQVIKYIGLKDDRPLSRPSSSRRSSSNDRFDEHGENHQPTDGDDSSPNRPSLSRSHSNNSISTPSSPFIKPIPNDSSIPALIGLQQRQQEENKTSLRRNATVKAPKPHFELSPKRRPLSISTNNIYDNPPRMLLLTDYCPLGNLAMFTLYHGERCLGERMFFKFAIDLMSALVAVHDKNIIHGDIKPQNCMIDTSFNLKLGDFSSSLFNSPDLDDGIGLGTTQYSSPEVVRMPPSPFSFPIDIFSAGLTLLFMITGIQPYEALTMASSNKPDRFTPKSHRSPHTTPGSSTPTSASSRRKYRSSSGAGKLVELHVHLSKGHAWAWEERRRLQDLEDEMIESYTEQISPSDSPPLIHNRTIHLREVNTSIDLTEEQSQAVKSVPAMVDVPESLLDPPTAQISRQAMQTYPDGHTPIQSFLNGGAVVPAPLRDLIRRMLEPRAANRPNSAQVLSDLKRLANWITLKD